VGVKGRDALETVKWNPELSGELAERRLGEPTLAFLEAL
jgi:hypothetical protein